MGKRLYKRAHGMALYPIPIPIKNGQAQPSADILDNGGLAPLEPPLWHRAGFGAGDMECALPSTSDGGFWFGADSDVPVEETLGGRVPESPLDDCPSLPGLLFPLGMMPGYFPPLGEGMVFVTICPRPF